MLVSSALTAPASVDVGYARRFRAVVEAEGASVARALRYLGVPSGDLDDATQEVFLTLHRRWDAVDRREPLKPWLRGVAVNVARNRRRARRPIAPLDEEPIDPRVPEEMMIERQRIRRLLALLETLPDDERAALVLFEIEGLAMKDVAAALDASLATAYRRIESAREALKKAMTREDR